MPPTPYELLVRRLYRTNLYHPVKLGLDNIRNLLLALDNPLALCPRPALAAGAPNPVGIVHVAGTNGKGSVCYKIASALSSSGYKTGLFVSPHVSSFRERVMVSSGGDGGVGGPIGEDEVVDLLPDIFTACKANDIPATFFEITTALALQHFHRRGCDCIVLETGLGGRLDATNVVDPTLSVVTSIGLEHTR